MKKRHLLLVFIIVLLVIYVLLTIAGSRGLILNLQAEINYYLIPLVFWIFFMLLSIRISIEDIGFFKVATILGVATGFLILSIQMVNHESKFETLESEDFNLILEVNRTEYGSVGVYKRISPLFSEYVGSIGVADYYEIDFEIQGSTFIVHKCTEVTCVQSELDLE